MLRPLLFRTATAVALATAFVARPASAQDDAPPAKLLPPTVYAYVAVPDVTALKERVKGSAFGALLNDPKLDPTFDQIKTKFAESGGKVQEKLGVSLEELLKIPSGELAFAVCDVPGESVGLVLIVNYGDNGATVDKLVEKAEAELKEKGSTRSNVEFEGTEIVVYTGKSAGTDDDPSNLDDLDIEGEQNGAAGGGKAMNVAWFRKDDRIVIGNAQPVLEAVLARWSGDHDETFAGHEVYGYITEKCKTDDREPAIVWFADPIGGLQTALTRTEGAPPQLQMVSAFLPTLGLTSLKGIGGSADVATEEFDSVSKMFLYVERPASGDLGVLGVFDFTPSELAPPEWVTDAATGYFGANWNVGGAVGSVKSLVDTFQGPGAFEQLMQKAANSENGPKLNPQTDFLDQLAGTIHMASYPVVIDRVVGDKAKAPQQPTVIAFAVKDEQKMKDVLTKLATTPNFPGESRQFQGATVYELPLQNPQGGEPGKMAVTAAKGQLIFSTDVAKLEGILRGAEGTPLAETDAYKQISEHIPDQVSLIGYQDQRDQLKAIYEAVRTGQNQQINENFDFSTLPPFEDIAKYLRTSGSYAVPDENGALLVNFSLKLDE
ncbi:MAG: hypothetical protein WBC44_13310 [Planctomycetaceae bacterium]